MNEDGRVILNGDDDMLSTIQKVKGKSPIRYGLGPNNDIYGDNITSKGLWGSSLDIHINNKVLHVDVPMAGTHMILNALAAASVGSMLGLTDSEIIEGIKQNKPLKGRNNIINQERCIIIVIVIMA